MNNMYSKLLLSKKRRIWDGLCSRKVLLVRISSVSYGVSIQFLLFLREGELLRPIHILGMLSVWVSICSFLIWVLWNSPYWVGNLLGSNQIVGRLIGLTIV